MKLTSIHEFSLVAQLAFGEDPLVPFHSNISKATLVYSYKFTTFQMIRRSQWRAMPANRCWSCPHQLFSRCTWNVSITWASTWPKPTVMSSSHLCLTLLPSPPPYLWLVVTYSSPFTLLFSNRPVSSLLSVRSGVKVCCQYHQYLFLTLYDNLN